MHVTDTATGDRRKVLITRLEERDLREVTVKRFAFNWKKAYREYECYKLTDEGSILGIMAIERIADEQRIEIKLLAVSIENRGSRKRFEGIAGSLIGFAAREAIRSFFETPCISLIPKTELKKHYIKKYGMLDGGRQLYLEDMSLLNIIKEYLS